jgi:predicted ATPase/class 3 adenylate cyclase
VAELPSGTVTFLFTDIEGSTRLLHELGDAYADVLAEHRRVLRCAFAGHGGVEVDTQGDAFFVAFSRATDALAAAAEAQDGLDGGPVRVRMGVHTGEPLLTAEGYVGLDVHRAARIAAVAHGGQVLVSLSTRDLAGATPLRDLGEHRLKDLGAPERIYQLGDRDFPPPASLERSNLPIAASPMIGRARELEELTGLLSDGARLVTVVGPGGTGKTRLALQAAAELVGAFDDVWFVPLAALRDPQLVVPTVAQTIGAAEGLAEHLASRRALLVLDNFEHLLDASVDVADLLSRVEAVRILATSRAPLRISVERELQLEPLPNIDAGALFVERARAAGRHVELDGAVLDICRRVDRLPLAIELAAARTNLLEPAVLLERLDQRLPLLTGGNRDAPERQRTLTDTIAWSYGLLDRRLQRIFRALSVFAGVSLEAASAVCGATIDEIAGLVDASLLKSLGTGRFLMLETIREYGLDRLKEGDELQAVRSAHAAYFRDVCESAEPHLGSGGTDQAGWFNFLEDDRDNLRLALAFFRETDRRSDELRVVVPAFTFWWKHGYAAEARRTIDHALEGDLPTNPSRAIDALEAAAYYAYLDHDHAAVARRAEQMLSVASAAGDDVGSARAVHMSALVTPDADERAGLEERALELFGDDPRARHPSESLGIVAIARGDFAAARLYLERSIDLCRASGDDKDVSTSLILLALVAVREGDPDSASTLLLDGVESARQLGDVSMMVWGRVWPVAAEILDARGETERALRLLSAVEKLREDSGEELAGFTREIHERTKATISATADDEEAAGARSAGRRQASADFLDEELRAVTSP